MIRLEEAGAAITQRLRSGDHIMIELGLISSTIMLFALPVAAVAEKRLADRRQAQREAARAELDQARERREAATRTGQNRIDALWRDHPDIGGLTEDLRFVHLRRGRLGWDRAEAHADVEEVKQDVDALAADRGGEWVPWLASRMVLREAVLVRGCCSLPTQSARPVRALAQGQSAW